jgi:hypothetical protein
VIFTTPSIRPPPSWTASGGAWVSSGARPSNGKAAFHGFVLQRLAGHAARDRSGRDEGNDMLTQIRMEVRAALIAHLHQRGAAFAGCGAGRPYDRAGDEITLDEVERIAI